MTKDHSRGLRLWLKNPLAVLAEGASGGIVVQGQQIVELVAQGARPKHQPEQTFDASQHVILPGLINTHHHFFQTLTRAFLPAMNKSLFPWLTSLYPTWAKLTPEMIESASKLAMAELLLSGCTTASDHHYVFPSGLEQAIDIEIAAAQSLGMRAVFTRGSMSLGQEQGGLAPSLV